MNQLPYHLVLRGGRPGRWRPMLGIFCLAAGVYVVAPLVWALPFAAQAEELLDLDDPTPVGLAYLNLVLASAIPVTWLIVRFLHGLRPRWLASVRPRIRWRWLLICAGLSLVALLVTLLVGAFLPPQGGGAEVTGELNEFTTTTRNFALVVLLLTPLQAAGEEYAFRGYLVQAFGGWVRSPWFAVVGSAALFALAHGIGQSVPIFFDRFAFGLVAGTLVIVTGGLEAGIAMHVLHNWLAFGITLAYGDMASALNPTGATWWSVPVTVVRSLAYLGLALLVARRMGLATRTEPTVLQVSGRRR